MWRKSVLLQFLLASLLLAGAAEARPAGSGSNQLGTAGTTDGRNLLRPLDFTSARDEGEAGSIINPDGVRAFGATPRGRSSLGRGGWKIHVSFDPHG